MTIILILRADFSRLWSGCFIDLLSHCKFFRDYGGNPFHFAITLESTAARVHFPAPGCAL